MTLRVRLTLVAAGVVAVVVALACATTYFVMRHELQAQLDTSLHSTARTVQSNLGQIVAEYYGSNNIEVIDSRGVPEQRTSEGRPFRWTPRPSRWLKAGARTASTATSRSTDLSSGSTLRRQWSGARGRGGDRRAQLGRDEPRPRATEGHPYFRHARRDRRCGCGRRRRLERDPGSGAPVDRRGRTNCRDRRAERARSGGRSRRARSPGRLVQHDARRARGVARDAAALRRRCLARAADAADEPADEHRRSAGRHRARP